MSFEPAEPDLFGVDPSEELLDYETADEAVDMEEEQAGDDAHVEGDEQAEVEQAPGGGPASAAAAGGAADGAASEAGEVVMNPVAQAAYEAAFRAGARTERRAYMAFHAAQNTQHLAAYVGGAQGAAQERGASGAAAPRQGASSPSGRAAAAAAAAATAAAALAAAAPANDDDQGGEDSDPEIAELRAALKLKEQQRDDRRRRSQLLPKERGAEGAEIPGLRAIAGQIRDLQAAVKGRARNFEVLPNPFKILNLRRSPAEHDADTPHVAAPADRHSDKSVFRKPDSWTPPGDKPEHALPWLDYMERFCEAHNKGLVEVLPSYLGNDGKAWLHTLLGAKRGAAITADELKEEFMRKYGLQVRPARAVALDDLVSRRVTQGKGTVQEYAERFLALSRKLPDVPDSVFCVHYRRGLAIEVASECGLDQNRHEWTDLHALIQFSCDEAVQVELRRKARGAGVPGGAASSSGFAKRAWSGRAQGDSAGKRQHDSAAAAMAAGGASASPAKRPKGVMTPAGYTASGEAVYFNPPANLPPLKESAGYNHKGTISDALRKEMHKDWVCTVCRGMASPHRHSAKLCPSLKGKSQK